MKISRLLLRNETIDVYQEWNKINRFGHMGHVREYTSKEVVNFMENIGFNVCEIIYRGNIDGFTYKDRLIGLFAQLFPSYKSNMVFIFKKT